MDNNWRIRIFYLFVFTIFATIFQSCMFEDEKSGQLTIIDGQVSDFYTKIGIPNVMMVFENEDSSSDQFSQTQSYYDTIFTDSLGQYHYEFINDRKRSYSIKPVSSLQYYTIKSLAYINEGEFNNCDFILKAYRSLKTHVVNQKKKWIHCSFSNFQTPEQYMQYFELKGLDIDTILDFLIVPEFKNTFNVQLTNSQFPPNMQYDYGTLEFSSLSNQDTTLTFVY